MKFEIADVNSNANVLARFFYGNLTPEYISHSELQGYRAIKPGMWADNLSSILEGEFRERLGQPLADFPADADWKGIVTAVENDDLMGLALVTCTRASAVPFGIIEDIVIDEHARGKGHGETMMRWIIEKFRRAKVLRVFLESGAGNRHAHELFERLGFKQTSIVMMQDLV